MRFLLSIPLGTSIDSLELAVLELLEDSELYDARERSLLSQLRDLIRILRHRGKLLKAEMLFVDTRAIGVEPAQSPVPKRSKGSKGNDLESGQEIALAATTRMNGRRGLALMD